MTLFSKKKYIYLPSVNNGTSSTKTDNVKKMNHITFLAIRYATMYVLFTTLFLLIAFAMSPSLQMLFGITQVNSLNLLDTTILSKESYLSSVEPDYFSKLLSDSKSVVDNESSQYSGTFQLDIPSLNIISAKVTANVPSIDIADYKGILSESLGHFSGTPIPGKIGNVFIYGHSTPEYLFRENHVNPIVEFTKLFKLKLGDKIYITRDSKIYSYTVFEIKEVTPDRVDVLQFENKDSYLLTLMTCGSPPGDNSHRLVVIAKQDISE